MKLWVTLSGKTCTLGFAEHFKGNMNPLEPISVTHHQTTHLLMSLKMRPSFFFFFLRLFIYLFLERGEEKEKERERNINVWLPLMLPPLGTWPATQACALTGSRTGKFLVPRPVLSPLSHTSQGKIKPSYTEYVPNLLTWYSRPSKCILTCFFQLHLCLRGLGLFDV